MCERVIAELVSGGGEETPGLWFGCQIGANYEERCPYAAGGENARDAVSELRCRSIIESQRHPPVGSVNVRDEPTQYLEGARAGQLAEPGDCDDGEENPDTGAKKPASQNERLCLRESLNHPAGTTRTSV